MEETYKTNFKIKNNKGFLLLSSLFVLTTLLVIVSFYMNAIINNAKVSNILNNAPQTYYLAEAGIQEAIWKLQNDSSWLTSFETDPNWTTTFTRNNALISGGSYTVTVANQDLADALITATSTYSVGGANVQRVVETNVFKALNESSVDGVSLYTNGESYSLGSRVDVTGNIFTNDDVDINFLSDWNVTGDVSAVEDVEVDFLSDLDANNIYDSSNPPIPAEITMPQLDFDSSDPNSYKSRADNTYNVGQFNQLLNSGPATVNGITYVTGNVLIKKGDSLTVNGILVSDGYIKVGNGSSFHFDPAVVTVNHTTGEPSGLLAKGNITIGGYKSEVNVDGLIYSGGNFTVQDGFLQTVNVNVLGGVIAQDSDFYFSWSAGQITIDLEQDYVNEALGTSSSFSPVLLIRHWEEEY